MVDAGMNLSYTFPNPLARLTGLLEAVARAREAAEPREPVHDQAGDPQPSAPIAQPIQGDELDRLSLERASRFEARRDDLADLSLTRVDEASSDPSDHLLDHGLCRRRRRRRS
jgi:hypothetical protein